MPDTLSPPPGSIDADLELAELVGRIVERRHGEARVSPVAIANDCMAVLDPKVRSMPRVYQGCHLYLRQLARAVLARAFDPSDKKKRARDASAIADLFKLQARYPQAHTADLEDPVYVRKEDMTREDVQYNIDRLRSEGRSKMAHADAIVAWWNEGHSKEEERMK
jgi:hypothetical protein